MTSEMTLAEAHGEDPLRLNLQSSADGFEAWNNNLHEIARHNHGERKRKKNDMIPVVLECGTKLARVTDVSKVNFVCGAIIFAAPLSSWLKCAKFFG
jgi:hypothetical protein